MAQKMQPTPLADLQEELREQVRRRIEAGETTGVKLAECAGLGQGHLSNFLNGRRKLSLDATDALLAAMHLEIRDLLPELPARHPDETAAESEYQSVAMVDLPYALHPNPTPREARTYLQFRSSFLRGIHAERVLARKNWARFILIRASEEMHLAMGARIPAGAALLVDRQYNSLKPYRKREPNIFLVRRHDSCVLRYVEQQGTQFWLRPANPELPLDFINIRPARWLEDYVVGRVAWAGAEV